MGPLLACYSDFSFSEVGKYKSSISQCCMEQFTKSVDSDQAAL